MIQSLNSQFYTISYPLNQDITSSSYSEKKVNQTSFSIRDSGEFLLSPGNYSIPVLTYCMNSSSSSPQGHVYTLDHMEGKLGPLIKKLNLRAPAHFPTSDIQLVLWSLQAGLSYGEMTEESRRIIDQIVPEHRSELKESFLSSVERVLNNLPELTNGKIPTLSDIPYLEGMRSFRAKLQEVGHDYEEFSRLIDTSPSDKKGSKTPWSKISENINARFVTTGNFGDIGFLQVRVLPDSGRKINSETQVKYSLDIASLVANPNDKNIQPLSFTPLFGMAGIVGSSRIATNPHVAALMIALALAVYPKNWDDFFKMEELLEDVQDKNVRKEIEKGKVALRKEHDKLEKPLKEAGIISGKDKKTSINKKNKVREYKKLGGMEQLEKDFNHINGIPSKSYDGMDVKILPDGNKIVKRPKDITIEVQPSKTNTKYSDHRIRVKVRYL